MIKVEEEGEYAQELLEGVGFDIQGMIEKVFEY